MGLVRNVEPESGVGSSETGGRRTVSRATGARSDFQTSFQTEFQNSLDIAFSPPGETKARAAAFRFVVDPRPEGNKVIERGNQESRHMNQMARRAISKGGKSKCEHGPLVPAASKESRLPRK